MSVPDDIVIADLRTRPDALPTVAERLWTTWWRDEGFSMVQMEALIGESLGAGPLPFTLVAHRGDVFLGTASVVAHDLQARPAYTPWLAAVFVERQARGAGIAASLVRRAVDAAFRLPIERLYLNAKPRISPLYVKLGWHLHERDVGGLDIFTLPNERRSEPS